MNFLLKLLAADLDPILLVCAGIGALAVVGVIICCVIVVKHKKNNKSDDAFAVNKPKDTLALPAKTESEERTVQTVQPVVKETVEEKVVEEVEEAPAEETVEETEEVVEETPADTVEEIEEAEEAIEEAEEIAEEPVGTVEETVTETVEEVPAEVVEEQVVEQTIVEEVEAPSEEEPAEEVEEASAEEVAEETVEEVEEAPAEEAAEESAEESAETVEEEETEFKPEYMEQPEEVAAEEAEDIDEEDATEEAPLPEQPVIPAVAPEGKIFIRVRYNRSHTAKIIQSSDVVKNYYTIIKNEFMRYGVTNRISWRYETFRIGRKLLARLSVRGKTLCVYFALNPADYADTKYKVKDVSAIARNADVPTLYKIKNDRRCTYAKQLIADLMAANGLTAGEEKNVNYAEQYPYEELEPLIDRKLVKLLPWKEVVADSEVGVIAVSVKDLPPELLVGQVSVTEAEDMFIGENVDALVEEGVRYADKTKKAIVNIDTLGKYFEAGENVTVTDIKKRVPGIGKNVTYIKVLARGTLDKALTIEADDYSPAAIKMIVLTGGKAIRTKTRQ